MAMASICTSSTAYPSHTNTVSVRVDYQATPATRAFARYSDSPGVFYEHLGASPQLDSRIIRTRAYVLGADSAIRGTLANELRLQYASSAYLGAATQDLSGGTQPANLDTLQGLPPIGGESFFELDFSAEPATPKFYALNYGTLQFQNNAVDNVTWTYRTHVFKARVDFRSTTTRINHGLCHSALLPHLRAGDAPVPR